MENLALFISGGATTATAIINACKPHNKLYGLINPRLVVASKIGIPGVGRVSGTQMLGVEDIKVISPGFYRQQDSDALDEMAFGKALIEECRAREVTLFGQYGWTVKTPRNFLEAFPRGINQHPAPLCPGQPGFGGVGMVGKRCHLAVLLFRRMTNRDFWTKAVAQFVHPEYDEGQIILQKQVDVLPDDTAETLAERVLPVEHQVQIGALRDMAKGQVQVIPVEPLVNKHELVLWTLAREMAKLAYPKI